MGKIAVGALAGVCASVWAVVAAANGEAYWALGLGFLGGANLTFALSDLRDHYRVLSGRLTEG